MAVFLKRIRYPWEALPYVKLKYIQGNGKQYINSMVNPKYNSRVVVDISDLPTDSAFVFGVRDTPSATALKQFSVYRATASTIRSDYFGTNQSVTQESTISRTVIDKNRNICVGYGQTIINTAVNSGECTYPVYLFALNNVGSPLLYSSNKLYSCQMYDNDILIRDYIPVKMKSSGEVGLWDLVNRTFYGNSGTGAFIAGGIAT